VELGCLPEGTYEIEVCGRRADGHEDAISAGTVQIV
jgi:hypothetical protein